MIQEWDNLMQDVVFNAYLLLILLKEKVKMLAEGLHYLFTIFSFGAFLKLSKCRMGNESLETAERDFSKLLAD